MQRQQLIARNGNAIAQRSNSPWFDSWVKVCSEFVIVFTCNTDIMMFWVIVSILYVNSCAQQHLTKMGYCFVCCCVTVCMFTFVFYSSLERSPYLASSILISVFYSIVMIRNARFDHSYSEVPKRPKQCPCCGVIAKKNCHCPSQIRLLTKKTLGTKIRVFPKIPVVNNGGNVSISGTYHSAHFQNIKYFDLLHDFMILSRLLTNGQSRILYKEKP